MHPVRTVKYAVTPRPVQQLKRAVFTATNPLGSAENALIDAAFNSGRRRGGSSPARSTGTASRQPSHPTASQVRADEAAQVRDQFADLMVVQRERFAPSKRPDIPPPVRPDPREFEEQGWTLRQRDSRWWQRSRRRAIRAEVTTAAQARVDELYAEAARRAAEEQLRANAWWDALSAGDPDVTRAALAAAFADNPAPVRIIDVAGAAATVAVRLPDSSVLPDRKPYLTPSGKLTTKAWTQTDFNDAYADLIAAHLLATLRETWAVAPSIRQARVIGVREAQPPSQVLFDVTASRGDGSWEDDAYGRALLDAAPCGLHRGGRTRAVAAWPADQLDADVTAWVQAG
jgi:hypothetical protein